jgi:hypothetical protein
MKRSTRFHSNILKLVVLLVIYMMCAEEISRAFPCIACVALMLKPPQLS